MKRLFLTVIVVIAYTAAMSAETKTSIRPSDLNQLVLADIRNNYAGYTITEAFKVNNKGVITYEVFVQKGKDKLRLYYDDKGKFIRKQIPVPRKPAPRK